MPGTRGTKTRRWTPVAPRRRRGVRLLVRCGFFASALALLMNGIAAPRASAQTVRWGDQGSEQGEVESPRWGDQGSEQGEVESPRAGYQGGDQTDTGAPRV